MDPTPKEGRGMEEHDTTVEDLRRWFDKGVAQGADYMIIVRDMFEKIDEAEYVTNGGDMTVHQVAQSLENEERMTRVLEVYDLHGDRDAQLEEDRAWAIPKPIPSPTTVLVELLTELAAASTDASNVLH